jgi:replicative DNA helicase
VKLVVIDYLQKVTPNSKSEKRTYEVGAVSGGLKAAAVANNVAMLTLAQLSREPDKDKGRLPRLSDLADSAQIERDADTVGLLYRPRNKDNPQGTDASLFIAKQRDGELGTVRMYFDGEHCRFTTIAPD